MICITLTLHVIGSRGPYNLPPVGNCQRARNSYARAQPYVMYAHMLGVLTALPVNWGAATQARLRTLRPCAIIMAKSRCFPVAMGQAHFLSPDVICAVFTARTIKLASRMWRKLRHIPLKRSRRPFLNYKNADAIILTGCHH